MNAVSFGFLLRLDQCFKSLSSCSAWICFYWLTSFSTFQTALQTLGLFFFCSFWLSMTSLTSLQFVSFSSSVLFIKAVIALSSSSSFSCPGLLIRRCHLFFDCVPAPVRKFFLCHSPTQFLCVKGSRIAASVAKLRLLTAIVVAPMIVSSSLRSVPFAKC